MQRRKWASCFEDVNSVIFLAALSSVRVVRRARLTGPANTIRSCTRTRRRTCVSLRAAHADISAHARSAHALRLDRQLALVPAILLDPHAQVRLRGPAPNLTSSSKVDLFRAKLRISPLEAHFPDYAGGPDPRAAGEFLRGKFLDLNRNQDHEICASLPRSISLTAQTRTSPARSTRRRSRSSWRPRALCRRRAELTRQHRYHPQADSSFRRAWTRSSQVSDTVQGLY